MLDDFIPDPKTLRLIFSSQQQKERFMDHLLETDFVLGYNDETPYYDIDEVGIWSSDF